MTDCDRPTTTDIHNQCTFPTNWWLTFLNGRHTLPTNVHNRRFRTTDKHNRRYERSLPTDRRFRMTDIPNQHFWMTDIQNRQTTEWPTFANDQHTHQTSINEQRIWKTDMTDDTNIHDWLTDVSERVTYTTNERSWRTYWYLRMSDFHYRWMFRGISLISVTYSNLFPWSYMLPFTHFFLM